ncbi:MULTISPECIES: hypothetical protein [Providencia]|uniref:hypothetical protein n=1 Tax=Providencia TaxID=586 RepID=UPI0015EC21A7|nr:MULTISPECIES: hypothetical protein [Providencia]QLQ63930.1 hypothetical protein H0904_16090 [Providencia rettgeri]URR24043.1 hypothetical protein L3Q80_06305 [Providencia rettgeri]
MEFKGSKSPWHIGSHPFEYRNRHTIRSDDNTVIAHVSQPSDNEQSARADADVRLIAAAPELLSELIRLRNIVASYKQDSGDNLDITDAVIAKALGQQ